MIAGRFEITLDEVDEFVEAVAMRTAARIAALLGHDPDAPRSVADSFPPPGSSLGGQPDTPEVER